MLDGGGSFMLVHCLPVALTIDRRATACGWNLFTCCWSSKTSGLLLLHVSDIQSGDAQKPVWHNSVGCTLCTRDIIIFELKKSKKTNHLFSVSLWPPLTNLCGVMPRRSPGWYTATQRHPDCSAMMQSVASESHITGSPDLTGVWQPRGTINIGMWKISFIS